MYRVAVTLLISVSLGACVSSSPGPVAHVSLDQLTPLAAHADSYNQASPTLQKAIASLPSDAGRIEKITIQDYADGVHQTVGFDQAVPGLKANEIDIRLRTATTAALIEPLDIEKPSEAAIRAELASQFPRMEMRVIDSPRRNAYGVYGFAVGKWANGTRCIYAWQWIDNIKSSVLSGATNSASVRVRLCRSGTTLDHLASIVDGLQLEPSRLHDQLRAASAKATKVAKQDPPLAATPLPRKSVRESVKAQRVERAATKPDLASPTVPRTDRLPTDLPNPALDMSLPAAAYRGPTIVAIGRAAGH